jgi:hypothetical protein
VGRNHQNALGGENSLLIDRVFNSAGDQSTTPHHLPIQEFIT